MWQITEGSFVLGLLYVSYAGTSRRGRGASKDLWAEKWSEPAQHVEMDSLSVLVCGCVIVAVQSCVISWWLMLDWGHMQIHALKLLRVPPCSYMVGEIGRHLTSSLRCTSLYLLKSLAVPDTMWSETMCNTQLDSRTFCQRFVILLSRETTATSQSTNCSFIFCPLCKKIQIRTQISESDRCLPSYSRQR